MAANIKNVIIDSSLRDNADNTTENDFNYTLSWSIESPLSYAVESVQIYNTTYTINDNCYKLYWTDGATVAHVSVLTKGNYNSNTLAQHIEDVLNTDDTNSDTYTVSYSQTTGKLTISSTSNFSLTFGTNTSLSCAYVLGFENINKTGANTYTGQNIVKLNTKYYKIYTDFGKINTYSSNEAVNLLCYVPNDVNFGDMINYTPQLAKSFPINNTTLSRFKITVKDDMNNIVNLNGVDWSMNIIVSLK